LEEKEISILGTGETYRSLAEHSILDCRDGERKEDKPAQTRRSWKKPVKILIDHKSPVEMEILADLSSFPSQSIIDLR